SHADQVHSRGEPAAGAFCRHRAEAVSGSSLPHRLRGSFQGWKSLWPSGDHRWVITEVPRSCWSTLRDTWNVSLAMMDPMRGFARVRSVYWWKKYLILHSRRIRALSWTERSAITRRH